MQMGPSTSQIAKSLMHLDVTVLCELLIVLAIGYTEITCRGIAMSRGLNESVPFPFQAAPTKAKTQP